MKLDVVYLGGRMERILDVDYLEDLGWAPILGGVDVDWGRFWMFIGRIRMVGET